MNEALPTPVVERAVERAEELAAGLYPHQIEGIAFLLGRLPAKWSLMIWTGCRPTIGRPKTGPFVLASNYAIG